MIAYLRLEVRRTLRDVGFVIFGVGMPVAMYLLFSNLVLDGGGQRPETTVSLMVGMAAYGALGSALSVGTGLAEDRSLGWLRQLRLTPLAPSRVVAARALTGSVIVLPAIVAVLLAGRLVNHVALAPWQWGALLGLLWLGSAPFTLLGLGNGYRLSTQTTGVVNLVCNLGLSVVGGLWVPTDSFPGWLRALSGWAPTHRFAELGWSVADGHAPHLATALALAGWLALFAGYALHSYRVCTRTA
ncbi:ABC transporter permease [Streptomyces sp. AC536]|uniref:ABC transporter permease n=1 Tax=Streptomyces buecherae TaxID=2763006 RepID=UPI00164EC061|nr:ABC transporter permease [Streptomyces buecherae]MBC3983873.1 ABC transporter permease [Streptomyces buecherae]QNJ42771.1 ABC transporter permease [Streptomyces buecherae]